MLDLRRMVYDRRPLQFNEIPISCHPFGRCEDLPPADFCVGRRVDVLEDKPTAIA